MLTCAQPNDDDIQYNYIPIYLKQRKTRKLKKDRNFIDFIVNENTDTKNPSDHCFAFSARFVS